MKYKHQLSDMTFANPLLQLALKRLILACRSTVRLENYPDLAAATTEKEAGKILADQLLLCWEEHGLDANDVSFLAQLRAIP